MKKLLSLVLACAMLASLSVCFAAGAASLYSDVPAGSWAEEYISQATGYGLMEGSGGRFGYGSLMTRAEFVTVLCRMHGWELIRPASPSFSGITVDDWYYPYVETALAHDVMDAAASFSPNEYITRKDMAVMLVRSLGLKSLAEYAEGFSLPFTDVANSRGYIAVAYDIGMINGVTATTFAPDQSAKREEAAAMLVRVYEKMISDTGWLHGFYALSSYSQRDLVSQLDAVSAGWSSISYSAGQGFYVDTENSEYRIPDSYESAVAVFDQYGVPANLMVYMNGAQSITLSDGTSSTLKSALLTAESRTQMVESIVSELTETYPEAGKNPYSGVTIDFEALSGDDVREGLTLFMRQLYGRVHSLGKTVYIAVQPVADGGYYDGFDFRSLGLYCDKMILMAHDYNATSMEGFVGTEYYKTAAQTPINQIYRSLRAITDPATGVGDTGKIALAISFSCTAWKIDENGRLLEASPYTPSTSTLHQRLLQADTEIGWSETYQNPYAIYTTEDGSRYFVWYEDERSIEAKVTLARLFGINGVSLWRLGTVPNYTDSGIYLNCLQACK